MTKSLPSLIICLLTLVGCSGIRVAPSEVMNKQSLPCPDTPNCVSSQATYKARYAEPLRYTGRLNDAREGLVAVIESMERSRIVTLEERYIYATFTSKLLRFTDDTEFYFDDTAKTIHVRSASRLGYYDFGVNRRRVERIRARFSDVNE